MSKKGKGKYLTIKVRPETYKRLRVYQAKMALQSKGEETYSMDRLIATLIDFLEAAEIKEVRYKDGTLIKKE